MAAILDIIDKSYSFIQSGKLAQQLKANTPFRKSAPERNGDITNLRPHLTFSR